MLVRNVVASRRALVLGSNRSSHRNVVKNSASRSSSALIGLFRDAPRSRELYYASCHHGEKPLLKNVVQETCSSPIVRRRWMSTSSSSSSGSKSGGSANASGGMVDRVETVVADDDNNNNDKDNNDDDEEEDDLLVYESPLAYAVKRLRIVSLVSAVSGTFGLPIAISLKGGIAALPSTGFLAMALMFCAGSTASTAAITYCFTPYVYTIHRIPVRKCHSKKKEKNNNNTDNTVTTQGGEGKESSNDEETVTATSAVGCDDNNIERQQSFEKNDHYLLKAVTQSILLTRVETVFDAETDVEPYEGLRPLCNFSAKGRPLYVHPECGVRDGTLLRKLNTSTTAADSDKKSNQNDRGGSAKRERKNPDDDEFF